MTHTITILGSTGSIGRQTLSVAEELGLPFTLKELRNYELLKWGRQHQDRELTDDEMAADDETTYWLLDRGWSNDEATFCGGEH